MLRFSLFKGILRLDGRIVWNVHNIVFGSKRAQLQYLLFVAD